MITMTTFRIGNAEGLFDELESRKKGCMIQLPLSLKPSLASPNASTIADTYPQTHTNRWRVMTFLSEYSPVLGQIVSVWHLPVL